MARARIAAEITRLENLYFDRLYGGSASELDAIQRKIDKLRKKYYSTPWFAE